MVDHLTHDDNAGPTFPTDRRVDRSLIPNEAVYRVDYHKYHDSMAWEPSPMRGPRHHPCRSLRSAAEEVCRPPDAKRMSLPRRCGRPPERWLRPMDA